MKETLKTLGYDPDKMLYMTRTEVELFSQNKGPYISDRLLRKRKEAFAIYFEAGKYYEFTGNQEVRRFIKSQKIEHFWNQKIKSEITLKGSIAYKGKVKGRVRLVFTQTDANRVQRGEIFIAPMTQVEFLSGLRKCGAIVTDEGGG
jgi:phosphoenolpyruvate synthase/pyruvate phosphate dikinase